MPPTDIWGGKLCFGIALVFIGGITALIGDLATLFGCCVGLEPSATAITLVALGTSLPDTFTSKAAVVGDDTADAAIGNVAGSNAVNVRRRAGDAAGAATENECARVRLRFSPQ